jgi:hypothetical protein
MMASPHILLRVPIAPQQDAERTLNMPRFFNVLILLWLMGAILGLAWEESCGNPVVFCYRISQEILVRRGKTVPLAARFTAQTECSIPSETSSTQSMTSRG